MNFKLVLKSLLIIAVAAFLVWMGMLNPSSIGLALPPLLPNAHHVTLPAGLMYIGFFGIGFLVGAIMMSGGKKAPAKSSKSDK